MVFLSHSATKEIDMFQRILLPTDGSDITQKAIGTGVNLARDLGAKIYIFTVKEPLPFNSVMELQPGLPQVFMNDQQETALERVGMVASACTKANVEFEAHTVEASNPWQAIVDHAKRQECDLIVMATHGRHGVSSLLQSSQTQAVLTHSEVPVLVLR
jgi:nucleotide-binding universal stress UspA family protein